MSSIEQAPVFTTPEIDYGIPHNEETLHRLAFIALLDSEEEDNDDESHIVLGYN